MADPLDSLAQYIATDLAVGALGTVVFEDNQPDQPDTCVTVYSAAGGPPTLTRGDDTDTPGFQIRSRSLDADTAKTNLRTVFQALHGLTETTLHGTHFKLIWFTQSSPVPLGRDEKQRFEFVQNLRAMVQGVSR